MGDDVRRCGKSSAKSIGELDEPCLSFALSSWLVCGRQRTKQTNPIKGTKVLIVNVNAVQAVLLHPSSEGVGRSRGVGASSGRNIGGTGDDDEVLNQLERSITYPKQLTTSLIPAAAYSACEVHIRTTINSTRGKYTP